MPSSRRNEYQDVCWLASGQHGHVFKCIHLPSGRILARKSLSLSTSPDARSQLVREMSVLVRAKCPQVLGFEAILMDDDDGEGCGESVSLMVEYCANGSLADWLQKRGPLNEQQLALIARETVKALWFMQTNYKLHHRDLKPSNLLITKTGAVKVGDFGECGRTSGHTHFGTLGYKAPECLDTDQDTVDPEKADVWSLGVTLVEAATASFPYESLAAVELWEAVRYDESPTLPADRFSASARHFVDECLRKGVDKRANLSYLLSHPFLLKAADSMLC